MVGFKVTEILTCSSKLSNLVTALSELKTVSII